MRFLCCAVGLLAVRTLAAELEKPNQEVRHVESIANTAHKWDASSPVTGTDLKCYQEQFTEWHKGKPRRWRLSVYFHSGSGTFLWYWRESPDLMTEAQVNEWLRRWPLACTDLQIVQWGLGPRGSFLLMVHENHAKNLQEAVELAKASFPKSGPSPKRIGVDLSPPLDLKFFLNNPDNVLVEASAETSIMSIKRDSAGEWTITLYGTKDRQAIVVLTKDWKIKSAIEIQPKQRK